MESAGQPLLYIAYMDLLLKNLTMFQNGQACRWIAKILFVFLLSGRVKIIEINRRI